MFSLRMLLAVVAISAVYIAGMLYRTRLWEAGILTLTYVIYAAAISAAILAKERRAFFVVFAVFGVAYGLCLTYELGGRMAPQWVLLELATRVAEDLFEAELLSEGIVQGAVNSLVWIGHSFFALLISLVAGAVAEAVVRRKQKTSA